MSARVLYTGGTMRVCWWVGVVAGRGWGPGLVGRGWVVVGGGVESLVTCGWRPADEGAPPLRVGPPMPELCTSDGARLAPPSDCKAPFSRRRARSVGVFVLVDHIGVWLCCLAAAVGSAQCRQTTLFPLWISAYSDLKDRKSTRL